MRATWLDNPSQAKVLAGICGILFGAFGVHKFVLGYIKSGIIMLLVTLISCGIGYPLMQIIGFIEGILYLTTPDDEFAAKYLDKNTPRF